MCSRASYGWGWGLDQRPTACLQTPPPPAAVAFACGTLPDVLLSLQLPAGRQSALFLPRLASLSLAVPSTAQLRLCCHTSADATQAAYYGPGEPYMK